MKIALVSMMRLNSSRLNRKLLVKVGSKPLAVKALETLKRVRGRDFEVIAAINPIDVELIEIAEKSQVRVIPRSEASRNATTIEKGLDTELRDSLKPEFTWVVVVNPSMPFLNVSSIESAMLRIQNGETEPFQTVYKERGIVWDQMGRRLYRNETFIAERTDPIYYSSCQAIWAYPVMYLGDPNLMVINALLPVQRGPEFMDVGNESDLKNIQIWTTFFRESHEPQDNLLRDTN